MPMAMDPTPQQPAPQQPMTQPAVPQGDPTQPVLAPAMAPPVMPQQTGWSSTRKLVTGITAGFAALVLLAVVLAALNRPDDSDKQTVTGLGDEMTGPAVDIDAEGLGDDYDDGGGVDGGEPEPAGGGGTVSLDDIGNARLGDQIGPALEVHTHPINNIEFATVDGKTAVLTASDDHSVGIWDLETGQSLGAFKQHGDRVLDVKILDFADGPKVVSRDNAHVVKVWELDTQVEVRSIDTSDRPRALRFAYHQGTPVAVGASSIQVGYWDLETGELTVDHNDYNRREFISEADVYTEDGRAMVVASSNDSLLRVVDVHSGDEVGNAFAPHGGYIRGIGTAELDGATVAVTCEGESLRVWDLETREQIGADLEKAARERFRGEITELGGETVVIGSGAQNTVRVWNLESGEQVGPDFNGHTWTVMTVRVIEFKDTTIAVSASMDGTLRRWSLGS
jgi:WD40 repeat protein